MSYRVNLLPAELEERRRARRTAAWTVVAVVLFAVLLGFFYVLKLGDVGEARTERDAAQAEVARLQAELAQLEEFRQLANQLDARNTLLAAAMASEVSWARILNDLAQAFPASASLRTLNGSLEPVVAQAGDIDFGPALGNLTFEGYSVERYAPGVEVVLLEFEKVRSFFNVFMSLAAQEEIGPTEVTNFTGSVDLSEEALTRRYDEGLPPEVGR